MPSFRLDGRRALVTGASRGLGLAMASALAEAGAHVVLAARNDGVLADAVAELSGRGLRAESMVIDIADHPRFVSLIEDAGPFDILVNNAGTNRAKPGLDISEDDYDAVMDLNVKAAYFAALAVARGLIAAGRGGSIINVSSQMGHVSGPGRSLYSASKHAMEGFTKGLALEWGRHGIRVNTICPTFIVTDLTRGYFEDPEFRAGVLDKIALHRLGDPADVMGATVFLASDASALMTGSALMLDGGWTAA